MFHQNDVRQKMESRIARVGGVDRCTPPLLWLGRGRSRVLALGVGVGVRGVLASGFGVNEQHGRGCVPTPEQTEEYPPI